MWPSQHADGDLPISSGIVRIARLPVRELLVSLGTLSFRGARLCGQTFGGGRAVEARTRIDA